MKTKSFFLSLSNTVIVLNILLGLGSIFLVERIQPAIREILEENAYSVAASFVMLETISDFDGIATSNSSDQNLSADSNDEPESQIKFWDNFEKAKENITLKKEAKIVKDIEESATAFWAGDKDQRAELAALVSSLAKLNLDDMEKKGKLAESLSITGAWGLGFLLIFSLIVQLVFRSKILSGMISPLEQIYSVLRGFKEGNQLRRFVERKEDLLEIKKTGFLINTILDSSRNEGFESQTDVSEETNN